MKGRTLGRSAGWTIAWALVRVAAAAVLPSASPPVRLSAQSGFTPASAAAQRDFEERLIAVPDTASTRRLSRDLTHVPHVAGRPEQAATRDYTIEQLKAWVLETSTKEYTVYLPWPEIVAAWMMARAGAAPRPLDLREPPVPGNPVTEKGGAVGLIIYSDPQDDGYFRGDVYPKGPMRPAASSAAA